MKTQKQRDTLIVYPQGELDHHSAQAMREEMDAAMEDRQIRTLILDLRDLTFMDSSGIGVLLGRLRILQSRGGTLSVKNMQPSVEKLFRLSGLQRVIGIEESNRGGRL